MKTSLCVTYFYFHHFRRLVAEKFILHAAPALLLLLLLSAEALWGQATTSLRGVVSDPSGGAVGGAAVKLTNDESKIERHTTTTEDGAYQFSLLPPGTYTLSFTA